MPKLKNIIPIKTRCPYLVETQTDGQKDTKKVIVSFSKFANAFKNYYYYYYYCINKKWNVQHVAEYEVLLKLYAQITVRISFFTVAVRTINSSN